MVPLRPVPLLCDRACGPVDLAAVDRRWSTGHRRAHPRLQVRRFFFLLVFFMLGVWFSHRPGLFDRVLAKPWVVWLSAVVALGVVAAVALGGGIRYMAVSAPFVAAGIVLAIVLAKKVGAARWLRPLRFVGRDSLVFYLVHWWPTSARSRVRGRDRQRVGGDRGGILAGLGRLHGDRVARSSCGRRSTGCSRRRNVGARHRGRVPATHSEFGGRVATRECLPARNTRLSNDASVGKNIAASRGHRSVQRRPGHDFHRRTESDLRGAT